MHDTYFLATTKSDELKLSIVQVQQWLTDSSATKTTEGFEEAEKYANTVRKLIAELEALVPENVVMLEKIAADFDPFYETGVKMAHAYIEEGTEGGNQIMKEFDEVAEALDNSMAEYLTKLSEEVEGSVALINKSIKQMIIFVIIICISAFLLTGFVLVAVIERVVKPVRHIKDMAKESGAWKSFYYK